MYLRTMLIRAATLLLSMTVAVAAATATTKATIDSSSSGEEGTPSRHRRNLVAKKTQQEPTPAPQTSDDPGGYGSYPRVTVENKTDFPASGQFWYRSFTHNKEMFHVNPGETWTSSDNRRQARLLQCVMANVNDAARVVPNPVAESYYSPGTSYAAFEIVNDTDNPVFDFIVQRPGGNRSGRGDCNEIAQDDNTLCGRTFDPKTCGDNPWEKYHSLWPPICGPISTEKVPQGGTCVCEGVPFCNERFWDPYSCDSIPCPPSAEPTAPPTKRPYPDDPWCHKAWEGLYDPCESEYRACVLNLECFNVRRDVAANCGCDNMECDCDAHLKCANNVVNNSGIKDNARLDDIMACVKSQLDDPNQ